MLRPASAPPAADPKIRSVKRIRQFQSLSRRGLLGLALFLIISVLALPQSELLPEIPRTAREFLGSPPPTNLVSIALVVYSFSALVLILSRMSSGNAKYRGWSHLAYLSAFYAFYYYGDALKNNFWAIFTAGFTIMALEHYHIWSFCTENIRKEQEFLHQLERRESFTSTKEE